MRTGRPSVPRKERRAKEAGERAASEAERAEAPRAQLRENIEYEHPAHAQGAAAWLIRPAAL